MFVPSEWSWCCAPGVAWAVSWCTIQYIVVGLKGGEETEGQTSLRGCPYWVVNELVISSYTLASRELVCMRVCVRFIVCVCVFSPFSLEWGNNDKQITLITSPPNLLVNCTCCGFIQRGNPTSKLHTNNTPPLLCLLAESTGNFIQSGQLRLNQWLITLSVTPP